MGFGTVLLGTLGLLAMFSTSAIGQPQMNQHKSFILKPLSFNFPSQQNVPPSGQPGNFNPFNPLSNMPQNFPSVGPSPLNQPGGANPNFPQLLPQPASNPGGFNSHNFQFNPSQNFPPNNQPSGFGPSSNVPQNVPPATPSGGFNSPQNVPPSSSGFPGSSQPYGAQPVPSQHYSSGTHPAAFGSNNSPMNDRKISSPSSQHSLSPPNPQSQEYTSGGLPGQSGNSNNPSSSAQNSSSSSPGSGSTSKDSNKGPASGESGNASSNRHAPSKAHSSVRPQSRAGHRNRPQASSFQLIKDENPLKDYRIVCLFNNRHYFRGGFTPSEIDPSLCTHVNYEFAILDPTSYEMIIGEPDLDVEQNFYQEAIDLRKVNPKLKVLLSLGGWADSTKKYSEMAADDEKMKNFVEKAVVFLKSHEFDGMDLAWEYPNCWQGALGINPKDKDNFVKLLRELKSAFKKDGMILSVSVGAIKREVEAAYDIPSISNIVDHINVMTYDMHGPWEPVTGHHVQFEARPDDEDKTCNGKAAMKFWADHGADKKKLNFGLALYAKTFTLKDENDNGMGAPAVGVGDPGPDSDEGGFFLYNEICPLLNAGNWTEAEDKHAGFYAYCGDQWACYDNPLMMVRKAAFVIEEGYGGVLLKDLSGDDYKGTCFSMPFPLLKMCRLEMIQRIRRKLRHQG